MKSPSSSYAKWNAIEAAAKVDGAEVTMPVKQLHTILAMAFAWETALVRIRDGQAGDDPEGVAEVALAEAERMIEAMP